MYFSSSKQPYSLVMWGWLTNEWIFISRKTFYSIFRAFIFSLLSVLREQIKPVVFSIALNTWLYVPSPIFEINKKLSAENLLLEMCCDLNMLVLAVVAAGGGVGEGD